MDIRWTEDQKKIIEMRNSNILVSAAAGSGKTAVLVERIYSRVMDREHPIDVDRFVVVTFTKAAAAQMRDRLRDRFETALAQDPENVHLQRQTGLISTAHISTVHSFCGYVIQNYFHRIGLDPSYRMGTNSELALLQTEILDQMLEEEYEAQKPDFVEFASMSMFNRTDAGMSDMIRQVYHTAMSSPFPKKWLEQMERFLEIEDEEEWKSSEFCSMLMEECHRIVEGVRVGTQKLLQCCHEPAGPYYYEPYIEELAQICETLAKAETYDDFWEAVQHVSFGTMRKKKDDSVEEARRLYVYEERNEYKKIMTQMKEQFFARTVEENLEDLEAMGSKIKTVLRLVRCFMERYTQEKRERNIVDFNDLEQLALEILLTWDEAAKSFVPSEAAKELSEFFEEIMIDEYQDSNRVQDTLLRSVSRDGRSGRHPNRFMVGDVKQSIYRFRNACPELFVEKLYRYETDGSGPDRRIDLHQNFRSREIILEGTNRVFDRIMHSDLGGVEYDKDARLQCGRTFPKTSYETAKKTDTYVILSGQDAELEGRLIATKIREMTAREHPLYVEDGGSYRPAEYRDIVILVRSVKSVGQAYFNVLTQAGIPVVMEHSQGFFDTREIRLMTSMLQVLDNPHQDMPLAAVLVSPMFSFTEEELAQIRSGSREMDLYDSLCRYERSGVLLDKIENFRQLLNRLREKISYATAAELIRDIYEATGIYEAVRMMPDGIKRTANMDGLMEQARQFDSTTYHGLFQFVRYINRIQEQKEELGEVNLAGEEENVVRIMTIHKSKGLEFPICIVGAMGKRLKKNSTSFLTICQEIGMASDIIDNEARTKKENIYNRLLKRKNELADLGEEMRILYVAMTRAKEKLILVGCAKEVKQRELHYQGRTGMNTYLEMVMPAVMTEPDYFTLQYVEEEELVQTEAAEQLREHLEEESLYNFDTSIVYDEEIHGWLELLDGVVKKEREPLPVKVSVSDLKVKSMEELDTEDFTILTHEEAEEEMPVPAFMQKEAAVADARRGAAYGTIWHQVMAAIPFLADASAAELEEEVERLVLAGRLRQEEKEVIRCHKLQRFFASGLGRQMCQAAAEGRLYREQPFVIEKPAHEIFPERSETETVLVQGIMDAFYEEDSGLVLVDYKTDAIQNGEEAILTERYQTQMRLYKEALENMTGKRVERCVLYSFSLQKEIDCPGREASLERK